ncbi:MAG: Ig-like domain-containing protein [Deltaproteobacteria bacterium]|nr:Ig-like domain-containing protein [Deltaproteobacteria bacterium]
MNIKRQNLHVVWVCLGVLGCSSPASIEVTPKTPLIKRLGKELKLQVKVKDGSGEVLVGEKVHFTPLTPTVCMIDGNGIILPVKSGNGAVLLKAGKIEKKVDVRVQIPKRIAIDPSDVVMNQGVSRNLKATLHNDVGQPMIGVKKVRWTSSAPEVVKIDDDGMIKTLKEGKATITAYSEGVQGKSVITVEHEKLQDDGYLGHSP